MTDLKGTARKSSFGDGWFSSLSSNKGLDYFSEAVSPLNSEEVKEENLRKSGKAFTDSIPNIMKETKERLRKDLDLDDKPETKEEEPKAQKYMQMFDKSHKPEFDILLKPENKINTSEIMAATKFSNYDSNDRDLNKLLNGKINSWYNTKYSTEPIKRDATGRQIEPEEKFKDTDDIIAPKTREGLDLGESLKRVSQHMSVVDDDDTPETGVNVLQKSINRLGVQPPLKEDGILGPKTALQTRMFLADNGYDSLDKAFNNRLYRRNT